MERLVPHQIDSSRINDQTLYVGGKLRLDPELWRALLPPKIATRLRLNYFGLNTLPTIVVSPNVVNSIGESQLLAFQEVLNSDGLAVGLPESSDQIVRSARPKIYGKQRKTHEEANFSEPALLLRGSQGTIGKMLPSGERVTWNDFKRLLPGQTHLLVHADHYNLQSKSLHGAIVENENGWELICATGTLHARNLEDESDKHPVIRLHSHYREGLFSQEYLEVQYDLEIGDQNLIPKFGARIVGLGSTKPREGGSLYKQARDFAHLIFTKHDQVQQMFGSQTVTEFRIYPKGQLPEYLSLQVLDVNSKF